MKYTHTQGAACQPSVIPGHREGPLGPGDWFLQESAGVRACPGRVCVLWGKAALPRPSHSGSARDAPKRLLPSRSGQYAAGGRGETPLLPWPPSEIRGPGPGMETPRPAFSLPLCGGSTNFSVPAVFVPLCTPQWASQDRHTVPPRRHPAPWALQVQVCQVQGPTCALKVPRALTLWT